ncbi:MAG TPA: hypothetical protein GX523_06735 [Desulfitobacterium dehalogenans]|uniref:Uncharacterized protein n=1 Tax=Desulfitobacterium dehalogenans TaxID=36854 RepID=A0A7C6Z3P0_9FIRM|nr:hypothetical protein [Desulfitobacterium dehalogenans]
MDITAIKLQYNKILERYKTAEAWLDSPKRVDREIQKWMPEFEKIVDQINLLLFAIGDHTTDEAMNGFKMENEISKKYTKVSLNKRRERRE